jgi:hypothetical protein
MKILDQIKREVSKDDGYEFTAIESISRQGLLNLVAVVEAAQEVAQCGFENVHHRKLCEALKELES